MELEKVKRFPQGCPAARQAPNCSCVVAVTGVTDGDFGCVKRRPLVGREGLGRGRHQQAFFLMYEPHLSCSAPLHTAQRPVSNAGGVGTSGESTESAFQEDGSQR